MTTTVVPPFKSGIKEKEEDMITLQFDESQNIEYKETWNDKYLEWICGFANAQGGKIFLGVNDAHEVVGVHDYPDNYPEPVGSTENNYCDN